jgi:hypothetical protein
VYGVVHRDAAALLVMPALKKLLISCLALPCFAPAALGSGGAYIKLSPGTRSDPVLSGWHVEVTGSVGTACQSGRKGDVATIYSKAFSTKHKFAGVPSIRVPIRSNGSFSAKVWTIRHNGGVYAVSGRCGGRRFASTKLYFVAMY